MKKLIITFATIFLFSHSLSADILLERQQTSTPPLQIPIHDVSTKAVTSATPDQLAAAMDILPTDIVSASIGLSDTRGVGVFTGTLGGGMPTKGNSFIILSTGLAATAETDNNSGGTSTTLSGLNNTQGNDMVQFTLRLNVPSGATCLSFDFMFYSEEFPEFVNSSFNDAFTAEIGGTDLTIVNNQIVAPLNFVFDTEGNVISVNTVFGVSGDTGTTYDGATPLIRANSPIDPETETVEIVLTIQDIGDSIYDSAVFIDNFFWGIGVDCSAGTDADSDGDSLLDEWEKNGIDIDKDGTIDIDLPAMGADPNHKDIFIEIDYMVSDSHTHKPKSDALKKVSDAFANAPVNNPDGTQGIRLHIDAGASSIMNPITNATWGALSKSTSLTHADELGSLSGGNYNWSEFDQIRTNNFSVERRDVFHYCVFLHNMGGLGSVSGIARGIPAADFIVSLGSWTNSVGTVNEQAGTLMHELGHTLGLRHGGDDHANYEPNFLSIMNYAFQMRGLRINGVDANFDYSRFNLPALNENSLNETLGLNGGTPIDNYGTIFFCAGTQKSANKANDPIDWNCNADITETTSATDINKDGSMTTLNSHDDWTNLIFNGGGIGQLGNDGDPPDTTEVDEINKEEDEKIETLYAVSIDAEGEMSIDSGEEQMVSITIQNIGTLADSYSLEGMSSEGWISVDTPAAEISLSQGESSTTNISITITGSASAGQVARVKITAQSKNNPKLVDSSEFNVTLTGPVIVAATDDGNGGDDGGSSGGCYIDSVYK